MKFSELWLREWVNPKISSEALADKLSMAGLEIESVTPVTSDLTQVCIGEVISAEQHPNADRLRVCQVHIGQSEPLTIVCGAANARAGIKVVVAQIGAVLPGNFEIKAAKIREIRSHGMLCSAQELGLGESSEGIMELPNDAPVGAAFSEYFQLPDQIIDVNITPNRADCLSIQGIAREVRATCDVEITAPAIQEIPTSIADTLPVKLMASEDCPRYLGRIIRGIRPNATTPIWMQERLRRGGIRSIHPVVDIANYVMLELGQPMHAFNLNTLTNEIHVRHSTNGESVALLDGQTLVLNAPTLVIADTQKILAIAGIMGGTSSAVDEHTTDIFLESAFFSPDAIRPTLRRLPLQSDSAYRYERGVDPELCLKAIHRASALLLEIVGGEVGPIIEAIDKTHFPQPNSILLRHARVQRILGFSLDSATIENILTRLHMEIRPDPLGWQVTPPSYRFDMQIEVDLIEEIARIYGYDQIIPHTLQGPLQMQPCIEAKVPDRHIRHFFANRGYSETINYSFIDPKLSHQLDPEHQSLPLNNPISAEMAVMRTSLWPGLLQAALFNMNRQQGRLRLFEIGVCFMQHQDTIQEEPMLAGIAVGPAHPEQWGLPQRPTDFYDLKGDLEAFISMAHDSLEYEFLPTAHPALHPGRSAQVRRANKHIGFIGELHPRLQQGLNLPAPAYLFELFLNEVNLAAVPQYQTPSKYPSVRRDLAFIVKEELSFEEIRTKIHNLIKDGLQNIQLFDIYRGLGVEKGKKSLALSLTFQLASRTLVDQEVDAMVTQVIHLLKSDFEAILRE